jgi:hypothetical protein
MSEAEIRLGRAHDDVLKEAYFAKVAWAWWRRAASQIMLWLRDRFG